MLLHEPTDWRAGCEKIACPVRREGERSIRSPYPYLYRLIASAVLRVNALQPRGTLNRFGKRRSAKDSRMRSAATFQFQAIWLAKSACI